MANAVVHRGPLVPVHDVEDGIIEAHGLIEGDELLVRFTNGKTMLFRANGMLEFQTEAELKACAERLVSVGSEVFVWVH